MPHLLSRWSLNRSLAASQPAFCLQLGGATLMALGCRSRCSAFVLGFRPRLSSSFSSAFVLGFRLLLGSCAIGDCIGLASSALWVYDANLLWPGLPCTQNRPPAPFLRDTFIVFFVWVDKASF